MTPLQLALAVTLAGAREAIRLALAGSAPDDTARPAAEAALAWLDGTATPAPALPPASPMKPSATAWSADFRVLVADFRSDQEVRRQLGAWQPDADEAATWTAFWLALLRLDPRLSATWRAAARRVAVAAAELDDPALTWTELPGPRPDSPVRVLVPRAVALGVGGLREMPAPDEPGTATQRLLTLAAADTELCHALEGLRITGIHPLATDGAGAEFRAEVLRRLRAAERTPAGTGDRLRALHKLDEAVCSAVHRPPAHPESWWGELASSSRRVLRGAASGLHAEVRPLGLLAYADLIAFTNADRNVAFPGPADRAGRVLACLRTWLEVNGRVVPGRVVFGSQ